MIANQEETGKHAPALPKAPSSCTESLDMQRHCV